MTLSATVNRATSPGVRGFKVSLLHNIKNKVGYPVKFKQKNQPCFNYTLNSKVFCLLFVKNYGLTENDTKIKWKALQKRLGYGIIISKGREI